MKCTNCGNNNACYHYRYSLNGRVTEAHLCPECAAKAEGVPEGFKEFDENSIFGNFERMLDNMFDGFFTRPLVPFSAPYLLPQENEGVAQTRDEAKKGPDQELSRRRRINALRNAMREAAEREDYEKAAELRNQLKELEDKE